MRKGLLCLFLMLAAAIVIQAKTYTITLVTDSPDDDAMFIEALTAKGYKVNASSKYWQSMTEAKVTEMNAYDLVIITRQTNSTSYAGSDGTFDIWANVTTPIINMSQFIGRNNRLQMFNTQSISENIGTRAEALETDHPIFTDIALDANNQTNIIASPGFSGHEVTDAGLGRVIAKEPTSGYVAIAEWGPDTAFYTGTEDDPPAHKGRRMWFPGTYISNGYTYNAEGMALFLNAVDYMIFGYIPDGSQAINSNRVQAETFSSSDGITVVSTSDTTGGMEDVLFTTQGQWAEYNLDIEQADYYRFYLRAYTYNAVDTFRVYQGENILGHVIINGGEWNTVEIPIHFASGGTNTIKLEAISDVDSIRINWLDYTEEGLSSSSLKFSSSAQVSEMTIDGMNMLGSSTSSVFTLMSFDGKSVSNSTNISCTANGNIYTLKPSGTDLELTFRVDAYPRHVSLHLVDVKGNVEEREYGLKLRIRFNQKMEYKDLSDLVECSWSNSNNDFTMYWRNLWGQEWNGNRGSVVIWDGSLSDNNLDKVLAEVWTTEKLMYKPAEQVSWTSSDVLYWVDEFAHRFNNMTQIQLEPTSPEELYQMMEDFVEPMGVKQVYLHCNVWRSEYWLKTHSLDYVNTEIFPKGREDLKAFADYLHERNMTLALHSLSYGIGPSDPEYIVGKVDRRLAKWTGGTLESSISNKDTRILYRPDSTEIPFLGGGAHTHGCVNFNYMRIGEEIVKVKTFARTEKDVWVITLSERGHKGTDAAAHQAGSEMVGLFKPYNQNYIPEFDMGQENSMSDELIKKYYTLVNEVGLDHLHFDGPEIHKKYHPWSSRPMLDAAYGGTNHPTTSSQVGGNVDATFELEFSKVKDDLSYSYFPLEIGLRQYETQPDHLASSFMGTHMHAAECILLNARRVNFIGIHHADGITNQLLQNHGLTNEAIKMFKYYKEIAPVITDADVAYIKSVYNKESGSSHYETADALILSLNDDNKFIYTPYHVLGLADGSTEKWKIEQELGALRRSVFADAGEAMALTNPKGERDLNVIIRVTENSPSLTNPSVALSTGGFIYFTGILTTNQYLRYEVGDTVGTICNKDWMPIGTMAINQSNFVAPDGAVTATINGTGEANLEVQLYVTGDPYILTTNDILGR